MRSFLVALLFLAATLAPAHADDNTLKRARAHFEAGRALFSLGRYEEAQREFTSGYQLLPRPGFLINIGQTYRQLGKLDEARAAYERFLREAKADDPDRARVVAVLTELEAQPRPAPSLAPPPVAPPAVQVAPAMTVDATPPTKVKRRPSRHLWWILPAGAAVVTGVALGVYFGTRGQGADCGAFELRCADLRR